MRRKNLIDYDFELRYFFKARAMIACIIRANKIILKNQFAVIVFNSCRFTADYLRKHGIQFEKAKYRWIIHKIFHGLTFELYKR